ncbi:molybdenum cofactor biosynthesis protein C [Desulfuribacillus stibiiarsenatis]|uniref:Cyclic pyranopterin monophosphate synthase n=1 Tax=Desulfuribacillus stibiiarsenatis TaxID=1390249 RepID=A0A1E5L535_9FIRM|nr:cyclic pyranopterin monophosphate synthase MoaC [Desulfuribacillus stibiiarsenatis]OEH85220.1 molybdenum cofactor biosynthesis protein C [Desulfuribacillus stibiiarsenatis]
MELTHFNDQGFARMVDVSEKIVTKRTAIASCKVVMKPETLDRIKTGKIKKGDVLAVAQVAGVMAAKKTSDLIPMCHPLALTSVDIVFDTEKIENTIYLEATVSTHGVTGVEMEALTAASATALTIYDMCKAIDKEMVITDIQLEYKTGGKSGDFRRGEGQ